MDQSVSDAQERLSVTHDPVSGNQERVSVTLEPVSVIPSAFVCGSGTRPWDSGARFLRLRCPFRSCDSRAGLSDSKSLSVSQERVSLTQELVSVTQERASVTQGFVLAFQARFSSNSRAQGRLNSKVEQAATRADSIHLARRGPS